MLKITIPSVELFDEERCIFIKTEERTIQMEHSLVAISKWESKWKKPFLHSTDKTFVELLDYFKCMTITQNVPDDIFEYLTPELVETISAYIKDKQTATYFNDATPGQKKSVTQKKIVTAEVIYGWMVAFRIDRSYEKWHLNKLITLIRVCEAQQNPPKTKNMTAAERRQLNAQRQAQAAKK